MKKYRMESKSETKEEKEGGGTLEEGLPCFIG
jgi:hypothetical protein